ncbi:hypothetical protein ACMU_06500 [Actibacterium mucosum KCTC 23349]|uniref:DUF7742 domain-containing protein n=1 Tax=Actibacterium mucosum KCTC 23349 TaxID=1454373 RepID=A0A037ZLR8_9RHOB|nr:hypothetical protein [Actibacterium mucosum]KAJ56589.1 hypothetical protein ACMU_06500 [Actibacterium mucosum KCTC 23349]
MRPVLHGDVVAVARLLRGLPAAARRTRMLQVIALADAADTHRKQTGRPHPLWGNGSLMGVVLRDVKGSEPPLDDTDYCRCLAMVFDMVSGLSLRSQSLA